MDYSEKLVVKGLKEGDTEAYLYIRHPLPGALLYSQSLCA